MLTCPPRHYFPTPHAQPRVSPRAASSSSSPNPTPPPPPELNLRSHNSKSAALILRHLSSDHPRHVSSPSGHDAGDDDRSKILELSLLRRRTPQFPGSIYVQCPADGDVAASLPSIRSLGLDEDEVIAKAIEIRRRVTAEILMEAMMKKGKFGITYSRNTVANLAGFVDHVMVEAASLKRLPEFSGSSFNVRAGTVIEESNVVPMIRWLKHNSLTYPQIGKLICATKGNLESIKRLARWLRSVYVKGEFIGPVMLKSGERVLERRNEELDEIVEYLENCGVKREWMGYVLSRCPQLLSQSMEEVRDRVGFFVEMGMNEKDFGTMVFDYPRVLGFYTLSEMREKVNYLKEFGLNTEEVGKLLAFKPQLMGCSIEERWKPLVKYLYYLGISRDGMKRMLVIKPMVFCVDLEMTIVPKVKFFKEIGIQDEAIGNMLSKFPPLLTYSLFKKIRPVVIFLMTKGGVTRRNIGKVIASAPELLGCSIVNKLEINVKYFLSLGIRVRQLGEMVADFPMLLRYNINLHRPKYQYLRRVMVRSLEDLIEFPRFLSYSLEARIIPRHKMMVENRINMKPRYMLACTDEEFQKKIEAIKERRQKFESGCAANSAHFSLGKINEDEAEEEEDDDHDYDGDDHDHDYDDDDDDDDSLLENMTIADASESDAES